MNAIEIILICLASLIILTLGVSLYCFFRVFYSKKRVELPEGEFKIPEGEIYEQIRPQIEGWIKDIRKMPHENVEIKSYDGLTLRGQLFEYEKGAPIEILFHGYRGNSESDLSGGVHRCRALGRSALLVDHRASGKSDGRVITFGVRERFDCLEWIKFVISRFGEEQKIILTGVSMGAATVMMAAGENLPDNVQHVLADCGYSSAKEIIKKIIGEMHLPPAIVYPFVRLGARIFGRFNLEETSPMEAVKNAKVPVIFIHGDDDAFVPHNMSERLYEECTSKKKLVLIKGAGHGLAFPKAQEEYIEALFEFYTECGFN